METQGKPSLQDGDLSGGEPDVPDPGPRGAGDRRSGAGDRPIDHGGGKDGDDDLRDRLAQAVQALAEEVARHGQTTAELARARADLTAARVHAQENERRYKLMVERDTLTGLGNRRMLRQVLDQTLAALQADDGMAAVIFIDLDQFKLVNQRFGYLIGDGVLSEVAARLLGVVEDADLVARLGGDEFAVVMTGIETLDQAAALARRLIACIGEPIAVEDGSVCIGASAGVTLLSAEATTASLLRQADAALYQAKDKGRGRFVVFDRDLSAKLHREERLKADIAIAADRGELSVVYQPKLCLTTGQVTGVEALSRWRHPELGRIHQGDFIRIAESTGHIRKVTRFVLETVCRQIRDWQEQGLPPVPVAINLSPRDFDDDGLAGMFVRVLAHHRVPPGLIEVEITEQSTIANMDRLIGHIRDLRGLGVSVALDDFGTGYSSFELLRRLPLDKLKLDRAFVAGMLADPKDMAIVQSVRGLAGVFGLEVIAEGIETEEEAEALRAIGYPQGQGFFYAKPFSALAFDGWRRNRGHRPVRPPDLRAATAAR